MNLLKILILATIGGIIGWVTNYLAIKLMFKPYEEIAIPIVNFKIQGLIPKRRAEIAKSIANTIETELFSTDELMSKILTEENQQKILIILKNKITIAVKEKLPPMLAMFSPTVHNLVDSMIEKEGKSILNDILQQGVGMLTQEVKVSEMVEEKINSFDLRRLEDIILSIAKKELKHIEVLGGVLGFLIGLVQGAIILLLA